MIAIKFTSRRDGEFLLGFINDYPDYQTQAFSKQELIENLKDLLIDLESGKVPYICSVKALS